MAFLDDNFLLQSETARRLYHDHAAPQAVLDFHCHLPVADIARDRRFADLHEIWLAGDHYKWRALRADGVAESHITGSAPAYEKFLAWARTVPHTLRNPLYHWVHLELRRYFGITALLDEHSAPRIWAQAQEQLRGAELSARGILARFAVRALCTSDDPCDDLAEHRGLQRAGGTRVYPTFRPDRALPLGGAAAFQAFVAALSAAAERRVESLDDYLTALEARHTHFHQHGCRLSDHGLDHCLAEPCGEAAAAAVFRRLARGEAVAPGEAAGLAAYLLLFLGRLDAARGWTKQLHVGAARNANGRMRQELGADTGYDSIGDWPQAAGLLRFLDRLEREGALPRMILYNLNPADNYVLASLAGNFTQAGVPGKIQFGSAWWYLDQKDGIEAHLDALSNCGLLRRFVGMVTDSRSFMSYPRHEYFRRVLCNRLGGEVEAGLLPNDEGLLGATLRAICFDNAAQFLGLDLGGDAAVPAAAGAAEGRA